MQNIKYAQCKMYVCTIILNRLKKAFHVFNVQPSFHEWEKLLNVAALSVHTAPDENLSYTLD